jgi:hypothetical protein
MFRFAHSIQHDQPSGLALWKGTARALVLFLALGLLLAHSIVPHEHVDWQSAVSTSTPVGFDLGVDHLTHFTVSSEDEVTPYSFVLKESRSYGTSIVCSVQQEASQPVHRLPFSASTRVKHSGHAQGWAHRPPPVLV